MEINIDLLLKTLSEKGGSDLHLKVGAPPIMRKQDKLRILDDDFPAIDYQTIDQLILPILNDVQQDKLKKLGSIDIGHGVKGVGRFRFNIFFQRGSIRVVVRRIPHEIPSIEELNLPKKILNITDKIKNGLVLIAGATGVGKSTTLATIINHINKTQNKHIVTIEDPIEFLIQDHYSLITQREIGIDCDDPLLALKATLRQDPDIILFSELRDKDTTLTALKAAETGHLVFSTIHTKEAAETISRIINLFASEEQNAIKTLLSSALRAVFAQKLIRKKDDTGYIPSMEILINNPIVRKEIIENPSTDRIREIINRSQHHWGMQSFDNDLLRLLKKGLISDSQAINNSNSPEKIKMMISGISVQ